MFRRSLTLAVLVVLAAAFVPVASAVEAHVRVEGRTTTIFGAAEPALEAGATALAALEAASLRGEFYYHVSQFAFGPFVDQIGRYPGAGSGGWAFKVNGASPPVGASNASLEDGDRVLWYWATFGAAGGPPTLELRRLRRGCYRVFTQDDRGTRRMAAGAVLRVDGRRVRTRAGRACVGPHRGLVRATLRGAVRSNALR